MVFTTNAGNLANNHEAGPNKVLIEVPAFYNILDADRIIWTETVTIYMYVYKRYRLPQSQYNVYPMDTSLTVIDSVKKSIYVLATCTITQSVCQYKGDLSIINAAVGIYIYMYFWCFLKFWQFIKKEKRLQKYKKLLSTSI